jgi:putative membrane protein
MKRLVKDGPLSKLGVVALAIAALWAGTAKRALAADAAADPELSDARIVRDVLSFDEAEQRLATSVAGKLSSPGARNLAERVRADFAAIDQTLGTLVVVAPRNDAGNEQLEGSDLSTLSGAALDRAYVDREVKSHETMLAQLDGQLIPNASEPLQHRLVNLSSELAEHLRYARAVQYAQSFSEMAAQERADIDREISNSGP